MSFSTLNIAASALYAAQRAAEVAANNVANANTPGFTKQRLDTTNAIPTPGSPGVRGDGMRGNGVTVLGISRLRDVLADLSYRAEAGASGAADARTAVLSRAEVALGQFPDGASASLSSFYKAWDQLNTAPQNPAARAAVLNTGRQVASDLAAAAGQLDTLSDDTGAKMIDTVDEVNELAKHVATLNQGIADAVTAGQSPNDLLDQRDTALDRLATLTGSTVRPGVSQQVDVYVGNSVIVSSVTTRPLAVTHTGSTWSVALDGAPATPGGQLGAEAKAVSVDIPAFQQQLDQVAGQLISQVNAVHNASYNLDSPAGSTTPNGGDFFTGDSAHTIAVRADLTENGVAASATGSPADGNAALAMSALRSTGNPSTGVLLQGVQSRMGAAAANAIRDAKAAAAGLAGADQRRSSSEGVNVDEEMVDMVKFQHSYEAAARVISMADGFLDTIINHMGAGR